MDNVFIADLILALLLLAGALFGAKRGLFQSLVGLGIVLAALVGAMLVSSVLTEPLTQLVYPKVEESVIARLLPQEEMRESEAPAQEPSEGGVLDRYRRQLEQTLADATTGAVEAAVRALRETARGLVEGFVRAAVFFAAFLVLLVLLKLAARGLEHVLELPGLRLLNKLGGGVLGLAEGALLVFLLLSLAPKLGITWFSDRAEGTHLLAFFQNNTPRTLIQMLTR